MIQFDLTQEQFERIEKYANSKTAGGWQNLFTRLYSGVDTQRRIKMTQDDGDRVLHYAYNYGEGGWQNALRSVAKEVERQLIAIKSQQGNLL